MRKVLVEARVVSSFVMKAIEVDVDPAAVGFSNARLDRLSGFVKDQVGAPGEGKSPLFGACVARHGKVCFCEAAGSMELSSIWRAFSMTKALTQVTSLILYEEGMFDLDDPISKFIPEFGDVRVYSSGPASSPTTEAPKQAITIKHLLTHTAGITADFLEDNPIVTTMYQKANLKSITNLGDRCRKMASLPLVSHPGEEWHYGHCLDIMGYVCEVAAGMNFREVLYTRLFQPLGMCDTDFFVPAEKADRLVGLYAIEGEGLVKGGQPLSEAADAEANNASSNTMAFPPYVLVDDDKNSPYLEQNHSGYYSGAGGCVTTAHDYMRFLLCLCNKGELNGVRVLGRKTVEYAMMNHLADERTNAGKSFQGEIVLQIVLRLLVPASSSHCNHLRSTNSSPVSFPLRYYWV
jgi:CubicO group peptidase (beta-lactamase class C family)